VKPWSDSTFNQGRAEPGDDDLPADRYRFAMAKDPREEPQRPGLSPELRRFLAIYVAMVVAVALLWRACT
jgi:hypothetical protein